MSDAATVLLSLIPWRLVLAGVFALVSAETILVALWHAALTHNRKNYR